MKYIRVIVFLIIILLAATLFGTALAGGKVTNGIVSGVPYQGEVGVKDVVPLAWTGYAKAETGGPLSNPGNVGWYWWTTREYCNGTVVYQTGHGGAIDTTSPFSYKYAEYMDLYHASCGNHLLASYAKFDFAHNQVYKSPIIEHKESTIY
jgi:hypothetical protein